MSMNKKNVAPGVALILVGMLLISGGCGPRKAPPLSAEEIRYAVQGQPKIFLEREGSLALEGVDGLYLGQEEQEALAVLEKHCGRLEVYDGGWRHKGAVFKGCIIEKDGETRTIRAGFWPHNGNRVSTLEIKHYNFSPLVVRARFTEFADALTEDIPRPGAVIMASTRFRLFASWDDGATGATHITVGYIPKYIEEQVGQNP